MTTGTILPTDVQWSESPRSPTLGDAYLVWEALHQIMLTQGFVSAPTAMSIANGIIYPTNSLCVVASEVGSADDLVQIDLASVADGRVIMLSAALSHTITIKHSAIVNAGEINLQAGVDLVLSTPEEYLWLQRRGQEFFQISSVTLGRIAKLSQDLDMAGFTAFGGANKLIEHSLSSRPVTTADRGCEVVNSVSCDNVLPMAQPGTGPQWKKGDIILFRQEGATCSFRLSSGGLPRNLDNHDRGRGIGAKIEAEVIRITPSFIWQIAGQTAGAPVSGTTTRVYAKVESNATIITDSGSTTFKNALALTHTPGSSEKWLYLAHGGFKSSGNQALSLCEMRFQRVGTTVGIVGVGRYAQETEGTILCHAVAYGASPGAQTLNFDCRSGAAAYTAQIVQPRIFGIRLETDENLAVAAGAANNVTSATYADMVTLTQTYPADDYYILCWGIFDSSNQAGLTITLDIDGSLRGEKNYSKHSVMAGYFFSLQPFTLTAASHTLKIRAKSNGAWNSTITDMGIAVLRKGRFQDAASVNDGSTTSTTSSAFVDKVTTSKALLAGWDYLLMADCDLLHDENQAATGANGRLTMNGGTIGQSTRNNPRDPNTYIPVEPSWFGVVQQSLTSDAFAVQYASQNGTNTATAKEASIVLLALAVP